MTWASRFGLLFASALMVFGVATGPAGLGELPQGGVSSAPSMHDDRGLWLRVSSAVRYAPAEVQADTWWAVCPWAFGTPPRPGRLWLCGAERSGPAVVAAVPWSSRAPPIS
ncbi:hypothetical protein [Saccharothrix obliqua]|uniref:hypothetical protein n=1 Tax=Saccharothrix obliqua TaxID=2861747 RepID=UPI001C5DE905|nr:hypothetical protein [Saccharothrix obliqua]MBW4717266.1 hypothetical protein [Saccharothrix obliqua]